MKFPNGMKVAVYGDTPQDVAYGKIFCQTGDAFGTVSVQLTNGKIHNYRVSDLTPIEDV